MQTNILNPITVESTKFVTLREGPHDDLLEICDIADSDETDQGDGRESVGRLLVKSLKATARQERLEAAQRCVEFSGGNCSLAWLVLAREGAENWETARLYAEKAIRSMERELLEEDFNDYCLYTCTLSAAMADSAQIHWHAGRKEEAISIAVSAVREIEDPLWSDDQISVRNLAVSLLIQNGQTQRAQQFLFANPDVGEQWNYLNALTHFSIAGDTKTSRTALTQAFLDGTINATRLIDGKISEPNLANDKDGETFENQRQYFVQTLPAWLAVEGSIEWLKRQYAQPSASRLSRSKQTAAANDDLGRWERWDALMRAAKHFLKAQNFAKARNAYMAAFHAAERIDYSPYPFEKTFKGLIKSHKGMGKSCQELKDKLSDRIRQIERETQSQGELKALHYASFANLLSLLNDAGKAADFSAQALEILQLSEESMATNNNYIEEMKIRIQLAELLFDIKQYRETLKVIKPLEEMHSLIYGERHFYNCPMLTLIFESHLALGNKDVAAAVKRKLRFIEPGTTLSDDPAPQPMPGLLMKMLTL